MRPTHREGRQGLAPLLRVKKTPVPCNNNSRYLHIVNTTYLHMSLKITNFGGDLEEALPLEHSGLHICLIFKFSVLWKVIRLFYFLMANYIGIGKRAVKKMQPHYSARLGSVGAPWLKKVEPLFILWSFIYDCCFTAGACAPATYLHSYERVLAYHSRCVAGCNYIAFRKYYHIVNFNLKNYAFPCVYFL